MFHVGGGRGANEVADLLDVRTLDLLTGRKHDDPPSDAFGVRKQQTSVGLFVSIGLHAMHAGPEVAPGHHAVLVEHIHKSVAIDSALGRIDLDHDVLVVVPLRRVVVQKPDPPSAFQAAAVRLVISAIDLDDLVHRLETRQAHCGADLRHLAVGSEVHDVVEAAEAEVSHQPDSLGQLVVVRRDGASLEAVQELGGVE